MRRDAVTLAEIAAKLGISASTVRRDVEAHELATFQTPGGHYRVWREEADRYVSQMTGGAHDPAHDPASTKPR